MLCIWIHKRRNNKINNEFVCASCRFNRITSEYQQTFEFTPMCIQSNGCLFRCFIWEATKRRKKHDMKQKPTSIGIKKVDASGSIDLWNIKGR